MTRDEYIRWVKENITPIEDPDVEAKKAQEKYEELTKGITVTIVEHDWKEGDTHMREVCGTVKRLDATTMYYFPSFFDFPHGSLDAIITVVSKENITKELAEILADLYVNLGAEGS